MEISGVLKEIIDSIPARPLLRVDEVADLLMVTRRTVYNWYETEKLKGTNLSGTLRIYRASLIEMIVSGNGKKAGAETEAEAEKKMKTAFKKPSRKSWVKGW